MLNKKFRLTKRKEFGYIYKKGKKIYGSELNIIYIPTKLKNARFGFVVSKKVGKAHIRNKIKRRLSEIIRLNLNIINENYNYIILAKPDIVKLDYHTLKDKVLYLLKKENLIK